MGFDGSGRLGDHVYAAIVAMIDHQKLPVGARLPAEVEMAQQFGVSRPIIRETLSRLRDEGLIVSRRGAGSFVRRQGAPEVEVAQIQEFQPIDSFEQIRKCYEFRKVLEGEGASLAARYRTESDLVVLREWCGALDLAVHERTLGSEADFKFHLAVAKASGNGWYASVLTAMKGQIELTIEIARSLSLGKSEEHLAAVQAEHAQVMAAIEGRDGAGARTAMCAHLERTCNRIFKGTSV